MQNIFDQYEEYDGDTLERVWQSLFKVYNQTIRKLGDNDFACGAYRGGETAEGRDVGNGGKI